MSDYDFALYSDPGDQYNDYIASYYMRCPHDCGYPVHYGYQMPYGAYQIPYGAYQMPFSGYQSMPQGGYQIPYEGYQLPAGYEGGRSDDRRRPFGFGGFPFGFGISPFGVFPFLFF